MGDSKDVASDTFRVYSRQACNFIIPDISEKIKNLDISILINNIGHRTGWIPSHQQPDKDIIDTISCGTFVQVRLTNLIIPKITEKIIKFLISEASSEKELNIKKVEDYVNNDLPFCPDEIYKENIEQFNLLVELDKIWEVKDKRKNHSRKQIKCTSTSVEY